MQSLAVLKQDVNEHNPEYQHMERISPPGREAWAVANAVTCSKLAYKSSYKTG